MATVPPDEQNSVRRINLSLIGIDLLIIKGEKYIRQACDSGDLYKLGEVCEDFDDIPFLFRKFFPTTRFWSIDYESHFIPNREALTEEYNATRKYLEENYKPNTVNVQPYAKETARLLLAESPNATDAEKEITNFAMANCFAKALTAPMLPPGAELPEEVLQATKDQNNSILSSFNPFVARKATKAVTCVYKYIHDNVTTVHGLPDKCVPDMAHPIFNSALESMAAVNRTILADPSKSIEQIFGSIGPTQRVLRMCKINTTLNGLLPENEPMIKGRTVALIDIRSAAQAREDTVFCFGTGTKDRNGLERRCSFESVLLEYFDAIRKEVLLQSGKAG